MPDVLRLLGMKRKPGTMGSRRAWANFEVRSLSMMASRALRHHADTMTHRLAAQAYFLPDRGKTLILIEATNFDRLCLFKWVSGCVFPPSFSFLIGYVCLSGCLGVCFRQVFRF